jgi:phage protein D
MPSSLPAPSFAPNLTLVTPPIDGNHRLAGAQIRLAEGQHALAQISVLTPLDPSQSAVNAAVPAALIWPDFTPVHFTYGSSLSDITDFYGYIASSRIQPEQTPTRLSGIATATVQYTLTGTSMYMQSALSRSYLNTTASAIARQIAAAHQLAVYTTPSPRLFPAKTQANQSDFAFLQALAQQVGARCWVDNALLYFVSPATNIDPAGAAVPAFQHNRTPGQWDTLSQWQPTVGESDPSGAILASHTATTVRSASGLIATATVTPQRVSGGQTSAPALSSIVRDQLAGSAGEAEQIAQAAADNQRYWVSANATVDGNTALRPGRQVTISGNAISGSDAGTWRICQAVHKITLDLIAAWHNTYLCDLSVGRDQEGSLSLQQPVVPAPLPGPMTLIGSTWQATSYGSGT